MEPASNNFQVRSKTAQRTGGPGLGQDVARDGLGHVEPASGAVSRAEGAQLEISIKEGERLGTGSGGAIEGQ